MSQTILISGASSGIGRCCALGLKARGYRVFAGVRRQEDLQHLQALGLESIYLDVNDTVSIKNAVNNVLEKTQGKLDFLFNNAGYGQSGAVEDLSRDAIRAQFETNVFGLIELTNHIIPIMRQQGHGRIVNTGSILGIITLPYRGAYNASKFALEGFTDTLRQELSDTNISVSLLEPGPILSKFRDNAYINYLRTINTKQSPHRKNYENIIKRLQKQKGPDPFTQPPEAVLKKLIHALENPRPKIRYYITVPSYFLSTLKRLLPARAMDWVLKKISAGEIQRHN
ncbi:SDR family NAD(P)-dependent oxidoreductase [soil metagenome]